MQQGEFTTLRAAGEMRKLPERYTRESSSELPHLCPVDVESLLGTW